MPHPGNEQHSRGTKRRKSSPPRARLPAKELRAIQADREFLETVRTGVERFILQDSTVEEFLAMIRSLTAKERGYSHQLTRKVFTSIVKQAVKKRNLKRGR